MEKARLVAQESRVRREGIVEQFAATRFDLAKSSPGLAADPAVPAWEESLNGARADLEKLGQVNLAAIDELKERASARTTSTGSSPMSPPRSPRSKRR